MGDANGDRSSNCGQAREAPPRGDVILGDFTPVRSLSPYFRNLHGKGVACPKCGSAKVLLKPTLNPDVVTMSCHCGHFQLVSSPFRTSEGNLERWKMGNERSGVVIEFRPKEW